MKKILLFLCALFAITKSFAQPANDACAGAITSPQDGTCITGTTVGAADNWIGTVGCQAGGGSHPEVWYTFVATGTVATFNITAGTLTGDIELVLVDGSCAGTLFIDGTQCGASPLTATFSGLLIGTTYFFTISNTPVGTPGTFTSCLTTTTPPPAAGQDCNNAAILCNSSTFSQSSSTAGFATQELTTSNSCWGSGGERQSKWFKFTVGCTGTLEFRITPNTLTNDYDWAIWNITGDPTGCTTKGNSIACNWSGCAGSTGLSSCPASEPGASLCGGPGDECLSGSSYRAWGDWGAGAAPCIATSGGITVTAGNTYALLVDNFSTSNNGFTLTFGGACGTMTASIGPNANFTFATASCGVINFTKTCSTTNSTFLWAFGDGSTSTLQNPSHTYTTSGSFVVTLTVTDALGCSDTYGQTISVNIPVATATPSSQTICSGTTTGIALSSSVAGTTYSWTVSTSGVSGASAGSGSSIAQTLTGAGTATYTVTPTAGSCVGPPITIVITVNPAPVATFSYTGTPYCTTAANPSPTFSGGGVAGTFTSTAGLSINSSTGVVNLAASTPGTYTVTNTIAASGGCPSTNATATITITAPQVATFSYTGTPYCTTGTNPSPTFSGGGVAGTFSSTAGLSINSSTGVVNLAASTPGTYTVTNTLAASGGCPSVNATATITITAPQVATFSYTGTPYCTTGTNPSPTFSGGGVAGTFTSTAGLSINSSTGVVNLGASTPGTYTVTNTLAASGGCPSVNATATITITAPQVGTFSYTGTPYCTTAANPSPTFSGGGVAGTFSSTAGLSINSSTGVVNLGASTPGTYTVTNTLAASGGCPSVNATATITINAAQNAAFSYPGTTFCQTGTDPSATITGTPGGTFSSSPAGLVLNASTGTITLGTSPVNTYTVTYTTPGPCAATSSVSVTITNSPAATFSYTASPYCTTGTNPSPTFSGGGSGGVFSSTAGLSINSSTGVVNLAASTPGTYTVTNTIAASGGCPSTNATATITITAPQVATFSYTGTPYCTTGTNPSPTFSGGGVAGTFTSTAGLSINSSTGVVNLGASTPGTYTVTNTLAASGGCPSVNATATITITAPQVATFSYTGTPYCTTGTNPSPTFSGGGVAGTFSSTAGLSINSSTGVVNLGASTPGTYTVTNTLAASGGCPSVNATATITITAPQVGTFSYTGTPYCTTAANPSPTFSSGGVAGTFSSTAGLSINSSTGVVDLALSTPGTYTVTNTIAASGGCPSVNATATITINPNQDASFSYSTGTFCQTGTNPLPTITGTSGGTFTSSPAGLSINASTGLIDLAGSGLNTYTVTYTTAGPCAASSSVAVTITTAPSAAFSYSGPFCQTASDPLPAFPAGSSGGVFSAPSGVVLLSGGQIDLSASSPGTWTIVNNIAASGGCASAADSTVITIDAAALAFAGSDTSVCAGTPVTLNGSIGGGASSSAWTTSGTGSFAGSTYTPSAADVSAGSVLLILSTDDPAGSCSAVSDTLTLTLNAIPSADAGLPQTISCSTSNATLTGSSGTAGAGFSWSGPGIVSGGSTATATVNATGVYTLTVSAGGCSSTDTVSVFSNSAAPVIDAGTIQILTCTAATVTLSGSSSTAGISYSWSGPSIVSGGSTASPTVNAAGVYTLTVTDPSNGCISTDTVSVFSNTALPAANAGADAVMPCGSTSLSLSGTGSSTGAGITYSWTTTGGSISAGGTTMSPTISSPGVYLLTVTNSSNGCSSSDSVTIVAGPSPVASFTANPSSGVAPLIVDYTNTSTNASAYTWTFGDGTGSSATNPSNTYNGTGSYTVMLIATNSTCADTATLEILVYGEFMLLVPNVFTPNGDLNNDQFMVTSQGVATMTGAIYDRWGLKLFDFTGPTSAWNGNTLSGAIAPDGTYYFIIKATGYDKKEHEFTGFLQLIR